MRVELPETIWAMKMLYAPHDRIEKHVHPYFHYLYVRNGRGMAECGGRRYQMCAGRLFAFPPGTEHAFEAGEDGLELLEAKFRISDTAAFHALNMLPVCRDITRDVYGSRFEAITADAEETDDFSRKLTAARLFEVLTMLRRETGRENAGEEEGPAGAERFADVTSFVRKAPGQEITLEMLASLAHMERSYFCRTFRRTMGVSPMRYVRAVRIESAKNLLRHSDMDVTQVAAAAGFSSVQHFSASFRESEGISPLRYKRQSAHRATGV